jgi:adenosylhomocysteinase
MKVVALIREHFKKTKALSGIRISACLHVTSETANLMRALTAGGAKPVLCASNPLSTQDDVAASLVKDYKIPVFAIKGENKKTYYRHLQAALAYRPQITMDDGADLVSLLHSKKKDLAKNILGSTEETTTGVIRLKALEKQRKLLFPVIAVNEAKTKHFFDNRYGTGQSTVDGIMRATNTLFAGKNVIVLGYGWCGKGVALRASGLGANVFVCEVDPIKALEARMDGYEVTTIDKAAKFGDIFITVTGNLHAIRIEHFRAMKDGAIVCNSGHFNVELDLEGLKKITQKIRRIRDFVDEYLIKAGSPKPEARKFKTQGSRLKTQNYKRIYVLGEGRLINLAAAEGHPADVMDMSFANQALSCEFLVHEGKNLEKKVYSVPEDIDKEIARLKLKSMGIKIDRLTLEQKKYLASWEAGT